MFEIVSAKKSSFLETRYLLVQSTILTNNIHMYLYTMYLEKFD